MAAVRGGINRSGSSGSYTYTVKTNYGNKPVNWVSWFDCARYCNWLHNGKPTGAQNNSTTEDGAYTLNGAISGNAVAKNAGAKYHIPTENEWYKAAYYKGGGTSAGYWKYATQSDSNPDPICSNSIGDGIVCGASESPTPTPTNTVTPTVTPTLTATPTPTVTPTVTPTPTPPLCSDDIKILISSSDSFIRADINNTSKKLYVVGQGYDQIYTVDTNTKTLTDTLLGSSQLDDVVVNETLNKIYVNKFGLNLETIVIDGSSNTVLKTIPTAFSATGSISIAINKQSNKLYICYQTQTNMYIDVINCLTDTVIKTINITPGISSAIFGVMHANEDDNKIYAYISNEIEGRIIVINGNSDSQESYISATRGGNHVLYFSGNLYITQYMNNKLQIIKLSDGSYSNITLNYPFFMDIDKQRNILYVSCRSGDQGNSYIVAINTINEATLFVSNTGSGLIGNHVVDQNNGDLYIPTWLNPISTNVGTVLAIKNPSACGIRLL
jgi:hypothetical protein